MESACEATGMAQANRGRAAVSGPTSLPTQAAVGCEVDLPCLAERDEICGISRLACSQTPALLTYRVSLAKCPAPATERETFGNPWLASEHTVHEVEQ